MKKLIIIGAGGHGKVAADIALKMACYSEVLFLDDNRIGAVNSVPVIGKVNEYKDFKNDAVYFVAIGNAAVRKRFVDMLEESGLEVVSLIHPSACIAKNVQIGKGAIVMAGAVVNSDTVIGRGVILNTASSVDHDNVIEEYAHIAVGAHTCGDVHIGKQVWVGAGAVVSNNIEICDGCMIGAGAVVVKDIVEKGTYIGLPAKKVEM